jgi:hypothetical protein
MEVVMGMHSAPFQGVSRNWDGRKSEHASLSSWKRIVFMAFMTVVLLFILVFL